MTTEVDDKQEAVADDNQTDALETVDLTLRIICEPADAARFPPPSTVMQTICRAVAETLELNGRFYIAPVRIAWNPDNQEEHTGDDDGDG